MEGNDNNNQTNENRFESGIYTFIPTISDSIYIILYV